MSRELQQIQETKKILRKKRQALTFTAAFFEDEFVFLFPRCTPWSEWVNAAQYHSAEFPKLRSDLKQLFSGKQMKDVMSFVQKFSMLKETWQDP